MLAQSRNSTEQEMVTIYRDSMPSRFRMVGPVASYRTKDDPEPVMPLPRWTAWAMAAWMVGTVAAYSIILLRYWE